MIEHNRRIYMTSKEWHEQIKPTSGVSETNRAIRSMETYAELLFNKHIVEVTKDEAGAEAASLVIANSYRPVMLIDAVAQKAIEHHFSQTATSAIQSSKESAALGLAGIRFDLIAQDTQRKKWALHMSITQSDFVEPYILPQLGNELGLTSFDISKALNAKHHHVLDSINQISSVITDFNRHTVKIKTGKIGRPIDAVCLTSKQAKIVTARYGNERGLGYLSFLIDCEKIATELVPQMVAKVKELQDEIAFLRSRSKQQALPDGKGPSKVLVRQLIGDTLPGFEPYWINRYVTPADASALPQECELAKLAHISKVKKGVDGKYQKQLSYVTGIQ